MKNKNRNEVAVPLVKSGGQIVGGYAAARRAAVRGSQGESRRVKAGQGGIGSGRGASYAEASAAKAGEKGSRGERLGTRRSGDRRSIRFRYGRPTVLVGLAGNLKEYNGTEWNPSLPVSWAAMALDFSEPFGDDGRYTH